MRKHIRPDRRRVICTREPFEHIEPVKRRTCGRGKLETEQANSTVVVDTEVLAILREQRRAIRRTVTEMLHRDSEILRRRYYNGQSYAEIAQAMGMMENRVDFALNRAQKRMHNRLCLQHPDLFLTS